MKKHGFTLVEVILATTVVGLAFLGLWSAFNTTVTSSANSEKMVRATFLAREKLEIVAADKKFRGWGFMAGGNYPSETIAPFTRTVTISQDLDPADLVGSQANSGYRRVSVAVGWTDGAQNKNVRLDTLITNW